MYNITSLITGTPATPKDTTQVCQSLNVDDHSTVQRLGPGPEIVFENTISSMVRRLTTLVY